ncbi:MAG: methyltransferase domain-containing protein [Chloroflexota bacterium]
MHHTAGHTHQAAPATEGRTIRWAQHYDTLVNLLTLGRENKLRKETIRLASIRTGEAVLDVGCGTGSLTRLAKAAVGNLGAVYGIDAAPEMIEVAQRKAFQQHSDVQFKTALIEALPFPDATFDVVLSSMMFHHLPDDLKLQGLTEILRVLKPEGRLLVVDMQRASNSAHNRSLIELFHSASSTGVQDLMPTMTKLGYLRIEAGSMGMMQLGFVQGQRKG